MSSNTAQNRVSHLIALNRYCSHSPAPCTSYRFIRVMSISILTNPLAVSLTML